MMTRRKKEKELVERILLHHYPTIRRIIGIETSNQPQVIAESFWGDVVKLLQSWVDVADVHDALLVSHDEL